MVEPDNLSEKLAAIADPRFVLETLFDEAPMAFAIYGADGRCVVVNRGFRELFGTVPPPDYNIFTDERAIEMGVLTQLEHAFGGARVTLPVFWYDAAKIPCSTVIARPIALELTIAPIADRSGSIRHVALGYKDVTAVQELERERVVLRTLFEAAPEAILIFDLASGQVDDANDNAVRLFGYPRDALIGLSVNELSAVRQPDGQLSDELIAELMPRARRGEQLELPWLYRSANAEALPAEIRVVYVPADGRQLCRVSIIDLRERRLAEAKRARVRELEEQNLRIHEANRLKSDFLAAMSHELRTPLNTIIGFAELVYYGRVAPSSPEHDEFIGDILTSSRHLLQLINDVLDLAKVEAGKLEFRPEPVVVASVISEVTTLLRTLSLQKRIGIHIEADRSIEVVMLDPARFKQVLYNYLSNALKFTPEGGSIVVRTSPETPESFRLEVEDSGIGIPPEQIQRLFLEFAQLDTSSLTGTKPQGTGLGLALTRRIVEAQGGSVGVRSRLGRGSVFHAVLPRETPMHPID
jgi:PAS domain S-box-containing protein